MSTPATFPISTASFWSYTFNWDGLLASETISQSAKIAGGLGLLKRGQVLYGPASPAPITTATLLTTATGSGQARVILAADIDTTGGPVTGLVYTQGKFLDTALIFTAAGAASDCAALWDYGIYVLTVLQRSGLLVPMMSLPATGGALPQNLTPKRAAELTNEQVEAIKASMAAWHPEPVVIPDQLPPNPPVPPGTPASPQMPAYAIAAFGEPPLEPWQEKADETRTEAIELQEKQEQELRDLEAKHAKELGDFYARVQDERKKFVEAHPPEHPPAPPARPVQQTGPFPTGHVMTPPTRGQTEPPHKETTQPTSRPHDKK